MSIKYLSMHVLLGKMLGHTRYPVMAFLKGLWMAPLRLGLQVTDEIECKHGRAKLADYKSKKRLSDDSLEMSLGIKVNALEVVFANCSRYGGGTLIAPNAQMDDGAVDVFVAHHCSVWTMLRYLDAARSGMHLEKDERFFMFRGRTWTVECRDKNRMCHSM
jgi:hypothetical protein